MGLNFAEDSHRIIPFLIIPRPFNILLHCILEHLVLRLPNRESTPACILAITEVITPYSLGDYWRVGTWHLAQLVVGPGPRSEYGLPESTLPQNLLLPLYGFDPEKIRSSVEFSQVLAKLFKNPKRVSRDPDDWYRWFHGFMKHGGSMPGKWVKAKDLREVDLKLKCHRFGQFDADIPLIALHPVIEAEGDERFQEQ